MIGIMCCNFLIVNAYLKQRLTFLDPLVVYFGGHLLIEARLEGIFLAILLKVSFLILEDTVS